MYSHHFQEGVLKFCLNAGKLLKITSTWKLWLRLYWESKHFVKANPDMIKPLSHPQPYLKMLHFLTNLIYFLFPTTFHIFNYIWLLTFRPTIQRYYWYHNKICSWFLPVEHRSWNRVSKSVLKIYILSVALLCLPTLVLKVYLFHI